MELWQDNIEDLKEETKEFSATVNRSGVYTGTIEEAQVISGKNDSLSKAVKLIVRTDEEQYMYPTEFFAKKDGTPNEYGRKALNKLTYLCKLKAKDLTALEMPSKVVIPELSGKKIGFIVQVGLNGDFLQHNVIGYFDIATQKTADEIMNKKNAEIVANFREKFKNAPIVEKPQKQTTTTETKNEESPEEFPF
nr:hypothetical protein [uncultured Fusobacterium sp.]